MIDFSRLNPKNYFLCLEVLPAVSRVELPAVSGLSRAEPREVELPASSEGEPHTASGLLFSVNEDRRLTTLHFWENFPTEFFLRKIRPLKFFPPVILAVHPSLVYTAVIPERLERGSIASPLTAVELENGVSALLTKNFSRQRKEASRFLGVSELDAVMVQSRLFGFRVGKSEVLDPVGVHAKKISATLEVTFTPRPVFEAWKDFFNSPGDFYFADANRARAAALKKIAAPPFGLLTPSSRSTHYFHVSQKYRKDAARQGLFPWGTALLTSPLEKHWGVSARSAWEILNEYARGALSPLLQKRVDGLLSSAREMFSRHIGRHGLSGALFLHAVDPRVVVGNNARSRPSVQTPPLSLLLDKLGFTLSENSAVSPARLFDFLAYYLEFYYDKSNSAVNAWLKRRVHWLTPAA